MQFSGKSFLSNHKTALKDKRSKTMKNERKRFILFGLSFYSLFDAWKIVGMTVTCNPCDVMNIKFIKINIHDITPITRHCHANSLGYCLER